MKRPNIKNFFAIEDMLQRTLSFTLCLLVCGLLTSPIAAKDSDNSFFQKHIMVVVDQSPDAVGEKQDMNSLYSGIVDFLNGKPMNNSIDPNKSDLPSNFQFNPETDEISLYAFGLGGLYQGGDWDNIHTKSCTKSNYSGEQFFNDIVNGLIHPRVSFHASGKDLKSFLDSDMKKLFDGNDPLSKNFKGVTMSHYVYPGILNFINEKSKAAEYYVIVVTNYKDGAGNSDGADEARVRELAGTKGSLAGQFATQLNQLKRPFYTTNWLQLRGKYNPVNYVNGMQLGVKSLQGVSVYVASNHDLEQSYNRDVFNAKPINISFNKNESLRIDSIALAVTDKDGNKVTHKTLSASANEVESWYDEDSRIFRIPGHGVKLGKAAGRGDLDFEYQFFATVVPNGGGKNVPYVFTANSTITNSDIHFINDKKRNMIILITVIVALLALAFVYVWRGRLRALTENVHMFTTHFSMTSAEDGTVELPCWFVARDQRSAGIKIDGTVTPVHSKFSCPRRDTLMVTIDAVDMPAGLTACINDNRDMVAEEGKYYPVPLEDQKFKFTLNFWIDPNVFDNSRPQRVTLSLRYKTESNLASITSKIQYHPANPDDVEQIEFFIKPEIGTGWIGIDPGTSGSCVAIGRGGDISNPNIKLIVAGKNRVNIIPSRLAFNKTSFTSVENAEPGTDYVYGTDADRQWNAFSNNGTQCFQSIKKLLGYQSGESNKIVIHPGKSDASVEVSGMELAHLLVRGLMKDTDSFMDTLTATERNSFEPNGEPIRRAVVAIPNNYTLPKTLDMVKSVAMTGRFEEVRPIFEAEAVLCNYLSRTAQEISNGIRNIAVFDMGGATINLTFFQVTYTSHKGSIYYNIKTLGRIGYSVGGDNIDYALMQAIFSLTDWKNDRAGAKQYQKEHKLSILEDILSLKKNLIEFESNINAPGREMISSYQQFANFVRKITGKEITDSSFMEHQEDERFTVFLSGELCAKSKSIKKYVRSRVSEVVKEILEYPDIKALESLDSVIFSGRSVLFPMIKDWALKGLRSKFKGVEEWNKLSQVEVKTAVAYGACWYGTFNSLVTLDNSRVASAYGFKLTEGGKAKLHVLVDQNMSFEGKPSISANMEVDNNFASDGNIVEFYQVMGSSTSDKLFDPQNRYKLNKIGEITIDVATEDISIEVKRSNQVDFAVRLENNTQIQKTDINVPDRDITDENDEAYIFAAYSK